MNAIWIKEDETTYSLVTNPYTIRLYTDEGVTVKMHYGQEYKRKHFDNMYEALEWIKYFISSKVMEMSQLIGEIK